MCPSTAISLALSRQARPISERHPSAAAPRSSAPKPGGAERAQEPMSPPPPHAVARHRLGGVDRHGRVVPA
eukprot:7270804-Pyramimonas_sp.AAC.1